MVAVGTLQHLPVAASPTATVWGRSNAVPHAEAENVDRIPDAQLLARLAEVRRIMATEQVDRLVVFGAPRRTSGGGTVHYLTGGSWKPAPATRCSATPGTATRATWFRPYAHLQTSDTARSMEQIRPVVGLSGHSPARQDHRSGSGICGFNSVS